MAPETLSVRFPRPPSSRALLPSALALAVAVASFDAGTAEADSPLTVLAVGAVAVALVATGAAVYAAGAGSRSTTTTTTTDKDGNTTSTTTTQSQRTQRAEALPAPDHAVAGREYSVDFSVISSRGRLPEGAIPVFPMTRMMQQLDVMLSADDVRSIEVVTERAITFEIGRKNRANDDQVLELELMITADFLKLSTVDIPETAGYSAVEFMVSEAGAPEPLLRSHIIVKQGGRARFSGTELKFDNVKNAQDLLMLKDVIGQARASLGAFETQKQFEIGMKLIGYGERRS